ncbi:MULTISPECIES: HNH endonuclease [unclassified Paenibacillus]|uniref:HNH endonuclease n=1 Tax=unclassified Paenibacillus TaxID=185978 RepID=UPI0009300415|nr:MULTISPECIES: HNH endonuclease [unclassified Paenibacillus]
MGREFYKSRRWGKKREKILRRDEYRCRECTRYGKSVPATTVHHCNPLEHAPELALASWNLVSMCGSCHDSLHDRKTNVLTEAGERWRDWANKAGEAERHG